MTSYRLAGDWWADSGGKYRSFLWNAMHMAATSAQENKETAVMLTDKIFLRELNSVRFFQIRHISLVIDHVSETRAKLPCRISVGIRTICWDFLVDLIIKLTMVKFLFVILKRL